MVEWVREKCKDENKSRNERKRGCAETIDGEGGLGHSKTKAVNATYTSFSVYDQDKDIVGNGDAQSSPTSTTQMFQGYQTHSKTPSSARIEEHMPTKATTKGDKKQLRTIDMPFDNKRRRFFYTSS